MLLFCYAVGETCIDGEKGIEHVCREIRPIYKLYTSDVDEIINVGIGKFFRYRQYSKYELIYE